MANRGGIRLPKLNRTQENLRETLARESNYKQISNLTNIPSKRLKELYQGASPTKSEASTIAAYNARKENISPKELAAITGFPESSIRHMMHNTDKGYSVNGKFKEYSSAQKLRHKARAITRLRYKGCKVTAERANRQRVYYYVIIKEDLIHDNPVVVGQGFMNVEDATHIMKGHGGVVVDIWYGKYHEPYMRVTTIFDVLCYPGLAGTVEHIRKWGKMPT